MNKAELIEAAAEASGLGKGDAGKAVDATLNAIIGAVARGDKVAIAGFGNFERRERAARIGRNPQTGAEIKVAASKAPAFKAGKAFKDAVNK